MDWYRENLRWLVIWTAMTISIIIERWDMATFLLVANFFLEWEKNEKK